MDYLMSRDDLVTVLQQAAQANDGTLTAALVADLVMPHLSALAHDYEELREKYEYKVELDRVITERFPDDRRTWKSQTQKERDELRRAILDAAGVEPGTANDSTDYLTMLRGLARREIVSYRDPDGNTQLHLFIDGVEVTGYRWVEADPGAGHDLQDWRESRDDALLDASPAAASLIQQFYDTGEASEFITGKERASGEELRTPDQWAESEGIRILNADGWRGIDPKPFDEPITHTEFSRRVTNSSCEMPALRISAPRS